MPLLKDIHNRIIRLTDERQTHLETDHPEMAGQVDKISETLLLPHKIIKSRTDPEVELFYSYYDSTSIGGKYLCVVVKSTTEDLFILTAYFTDTIKRGDVLWEKQ